MRTKALVGIHSNAATQARRAFPRVRELLLCAGLFATIAVANATVITLDATQRGFITQSGATNPTNLPPGSRDYLLGNCAFASCPVTGGGEYRDFFAFTIPVLGGAVTSVEFQISTASVDLSQSSSLTGLFTSLNTITSFAALGTGIAYGSMTYGTADANTTKNIALNPSAIAAILADQGGTFLIGDRTQSATEFDPASPNQLVFEHSGPDNLTRLVITTAEVSEPASLALVGFALWPLLGFRFLQRRRSSTCGQETCAAARSAG